MKKPSLSQLTFVQGEPHHVAKAIVQSYTERDSIMVIHYMYYASYYSVTKNSKLLATYALADYILPDGIGMQLCFWMLRGAWICNLNGTDMTPLMMQEAVAIQMPIAMYGTTVENIQGCASRFCEEYGKPLSYFQDGYSSLDLRNVPDGALLIIGMGTPRQELWVQEHIEALKAKKLLVVTAGGFLDFYCGYYIRAPRIVRMLKLEWLWRTILHPARHYHKRLRDMTVVFLPLWHRIIGVSRSIRIKYL